MQDKSPQTPLLSQEEIKELKERLAKQLRGNTWLTILVIVLLLYCLMGAMNGLNKDKPTSDLAGYPKMYRRLKNLEEKTKEQEIKMRELEKEIQVLKEKEN
ncbi:hypothetical protein D3H64_07285 [Atopobacter sp. AH10]|uniref:hypothetical protein n=1 Tax=Atopobacter sp. AH10 TaxID=2315861 RepID=UPI000EF22730|nr:hypothetical protein [Atopobacter sp. AH10]RLK62876.1 hypothetical protein D3H64_07285 [Atopobacter sp. AH10]